MNLALPTLEYLKLTQPHIYDDNWLCPKCNIEKETWYHVFLCPQQRRFLELCIELTIEKLVDACVNYTIDSNDNFKDKLNKLNIWQIPTDLSSYNSRKHCNILDLIRGVIPYQLPRFIKSNVFADTKMSEINNICIRSLSYFILLVKREIWIERCDTLKEIQQERGLDRRKLRIKYAHRNRRPSDSENTSFIQTSTNIVSTPYNYTDTFERYIEYGLHN